MNCPSRFQWRVIITRISLGLIVLAGLVFLGHFIGEYIPYMENAVAHMGHWGPIVFTVAFVVFTAIFVPADVLLLCAGAMFDFLWGYIFSSIATFIAAAALFFPARWGVKTFIERSLKKHPKLQSINNCVGDEGFKLIFLLRLGPIPFTPLSYLLSISRVRFWPYFFASVGMLLSNISMVYYGYAAKHLMKYAGGVEDKSPAHYIGLIIGVVVAIITMLYVTFLVKKALKRYSDAAESKTPVKPQPDSQLAADTMPGQPIV